MFADFFDLPSIAVPNGFQHSERFFNAPPHIPFVSYPGLHFPPGKPIGLEAEAESLKGEAKRGTNGQGGDPGRGRPACQTRRIHVIRIRIL